MDRFGPHFNGFPGLCAHTVLLPVATAVFFRRGSGKIRIRRARVGSVRRRIVPLCRSRILQECSVCLTLPSLSEITAKRKSGRAKSMGPVWDKGANCGERVHPRFNWNTSEAYALTLTPLPYPCYNGLYAASGFVK